MQWLIDLVIEAIGIPPTFIDRGDPAAADYAIGDFTKDNAWHELDLSAIVPERATAVLFAIRLTWGATGKEFRLRKHGNANDNAISAIETQLLNVRVQADLVCACDSDRKVDYWAEAGIPGTIFLTVKAWWL